MHRLEELIKKLCPNGVEYKELEKITKSVNIGINPRKFFKLNPDDATGFYVTVRELNGLNGVIQTEKTDLINDDAIKTIQARANIENGDILFSNTGTVGKMALVNYETLNWGVNEGIFVIKPNNEIVNSKYLYYYLDSNLAYAEYSKMFTGSTMKHITQKALLSISIPVPPLEIQCEIVHILDAFTSLSLELSSELKARQKQYEYYRNTLVNKEKNKSLSEILKIKNGKDYKALGDGNIPVYGTGGIMTYTSKFAYDKPSVLIPRKGSLNKLYYVEEPFWNVDTIFYTEINEEIVIPKYVFYCLENEHLEELNTAGGVPSLTQAVLNKVKIYIPGLDEQKKIVGILDKLYYLVNDISLGLPAEIEKRQKQYEYYRDLLLSFKEVQYE